MARHTVLRNPAGTNWPSGRKQAESTRGNTTKMYAVSGTRLNVCSDDSNFFCKVYNAALQKRHHVHGIYSVRSYYYFAQLVSIRPNIEEQEIKTESQ